MNSFRKFSMSSSNSSVLFDEFNQNACKNILCKQDYVKCVYLLASSNRSQCYNRISFTICTGGEVFDRLVGVSTGLFLVKGK